VYHLCFDESEPRNRSEKIYKPNNKMKNNTTIKPIGLITAFLFCAMLIHAQDNLMGIRAGVTISRQAFHNGNIGNDATSKLGGDLAIVTDFQFAPFFSFGPEFHWMQKGAKIKDLNGPIGEVTRTFNYLEIPLLLRLHVGEPGGIFFMAGPSFGYLLDGSDKDNDGKTNDVDLDFYKRIELGVHVGGGISLGPIRVDVRYMAGISNIADFEGSDIQIKNSGFGAGVGFMF
jgi:hypothetical protein